MNTINDPILIMQVTQQLKLIRSLTINEASLVIRVYCHATVSLIIPTLIILKITNLDPMSCTPADSTSPIQTGFATRALHRGSCTSAVLSRTVMSAAVGSSRFKNLSENICHLETGTQLLWPNAHLSGKYCSRFSEP